MSSDQYSEFITRDFDGEVAEETDFDTLSHREYLYSVLNKPFDYKSKVDLIKKKYEIVDIHSKEEWKDILLSLEYLEECHKGMFIPKCDYSMGEKYLERFLAYLIFRHVSIAYSDDNLRARLGFCLLLTDILAGYLSSATMNFAQICDFVRIISEEIEYSDDNTDSLIFEFEIY